jgi:chemotaxis protein MotA
MDIATIVGIVFGVGSIVMGILLGGTLNAFIDYPSMSIVFGGTLASTLVNYPMSDILSVIGITKNVFMQKELSAGELITKFVRYAELARKEGILALENEADKTVDEFIKKGLQLAVDGTSPELLRNILETELLYLEDRHKLGVGIYEAMGYYAPAFGMIGTLIGLINMLKTLDDPTNIGVGMAVALITTFYGAVFANLICLPIAGKLKKRSQNEVLVKEIVSEGILSIQSGDNPRVVGEKLKAFLSPKIRSTIQRK